MDTLVGLLPLVLIFVVMYFLLIRPQQKRSQEQQKLIASLEPGDEVVTIGGIFGDIVEVDDAEVILEVYDGTQMKFLRSAIARKVLAEDAFAEAEEIDLVEDEPEELPEAEPAAADEDAPAANTASKAKKTDEPEERDEA